MSAIEAGVLFLRTLLEGVIIILSIYLLSNKQINKRLLVISGILVGVSIFLVRLLPIHFGVHTIILLIIMIFISIKICSIEIRKAITSCIIFTILLFACEWISTIAYVSLLGQSVELLFNKSVMSTLMSIPPLFLALLMAVIINLIRGQKQKRVE